MPRWEPDAPQRLADAALELFAKNGYDNTTVLDIAQHAGLTKSTFFRHFASKREVLFGEDVLTEHLARAVASAPAGASPFESVTVGLEALGQEIFTPDYRTFATRRRTVIEAHPDLQEREALKLLNLAGSVARALTHRGTPALTAQVTAELSMVVLKVTYERWTDLDNISEYGAITRQVLGEVHAVLSTGVRQEA